MQNFHRLSRASPNLWAGFIFACKIIGCVLGFHQAHTKASNHYFVLSEAKNMQNRRININLPSDYQAALIEKWSKATNRPVSSMACYLVEKGLETALKEGIVPAEIVSLVNGYFFADL